MTQRAFDILIGATNRTEDGLNAAEQGIKRFQRTLIQSAEDTRQQMDRSAESLRMNIEKRFASAESDAFDKIADANTLALEKRAALGDVQSQQLLEHLKLESQQLRERQDLLAVSRNTLLTDQTRAQAAALLVDLDKLHTRELERQDRVFNRRVGAQAAGEGFFGISPERVTKMRGAMDEWNAALLRNAGAAGLLMFAARRLNAALDEMAKTQRQVADGESSIADGAEEMGRSVARSLPIFGEWFRAGEKIRLLFTDTAKIEAQLALETAEHTANIEQQRRVYVASESAIGAATAANKEWIASLRSPLSGPDEIQRRMRDDLRRLDEQIADASTALRAARGSPAHQGSIEALESEIASLEARRASIEFHAESDRIHAIESLRREGEGRIADIENEAEQLRLRERDRNLDAELRAIDDAFDKKKDVILRRNAEMLRLMPGFFGQTGKEQTRNEIAALEKLREAQRAAVSRAAADADKQKRAETSLTIERLRIDLLGEMGRLGDQEAEKEAQRLRVLQQRRAIEAEITAIILDRGTSEKQRSEAKQLLALVAMLGDRTTGNAAGDSRRSFLARLEQGPFSTGVQQTFGGERDPQKPVVDKLAKIERIQERQAETTRALLELIRRGNPLVAGVFQNN